MSRKLLPAVYPKVTVEYYKRDKDIFAFAEDQWWHLLFREEEIYCGRKPWRDAKTGQVYMERIYMTNLIPVAANKIERPENIKPDGKEVVGKFTDDMTIEEILFKRQF